MRSKASWESLGFDGLVRMTPLLVIAVLLLLLWPIFSQGLPQLSIDFFLSEPRLSGRAGGISTILASNALILIVCMGSALPLGLATAVFLAEFSSRHQGFGRYVQVTLDILAGVPSIVFGLFGNAFFCKILGLGFSILSGGLTLACMVLPLFIRTAEEGLRQVPLDYRLGAAGLGLSKRAALVHLLIPAAMPSLVVGFVLGLGRALAETAALVFTSGYVDRMPESLLDSGRSLSIHIFDLAMNVPGGDAKAYASSLTLVLSLLIINALAAGLARFWQLKHRGT